MQKAKLVLFKLNQKSNANKNFRFKRLYRNLFNTDFYLNAYAKIYHKEGNLTKGITEETIDGFNYKRINDIIEKIRFEKYYPNPVRRTYIPKKNNKKRPLGIPSFDDKLVQEIIRQILDAIYEPLFTDSSHGFRPNRSCQTALYKIKKECNGSIWTIEGDITGFFDNINHEILIKILKEKIDDGRFIELLSRFLKAGYIENGIKYDTTTGTPQGGIISPILANIYLNELDKYMTNIIKFHTKGKSRKRNPFYHYLSETRRRCRKKGDYKTANEILKKMHKTPSKIAMDENYQRVRYIRYADDFLIFTIGSKEFTLEIKKEISVFLKEKLQLELNEEKTIITNLSNGKVKFLGYEITKLKDDTCITKTINNKKIRAINSRLALLVPREVINKKIRTFSRKRIPKPFNPRIFLPLLETITQYNAEIRGLYNYYCLANNVSKEIHRFKYYHYFSLVKTIASKEKSTIKKVISKYGIRVKKKSGNGTFNLIGIKYKTKTEEKILTYFNDSISKREYPSTLNLAPDVMFYDSHCQLIDRFNKGLCELCGKNGSKSDFEVHHVRKLKDIKLKYRKRGKEMPKWVLRMSKLNRKTLILCKDCHTNLHRGKI